MVDDFLPIDVLGSGSVRRTKIVPNFMLVDVLTTAGRWNTEQPLLTYLVPDEMEGELQVGQLVAVPYGERLVEGIVWEVRWKDDDPDVGGEENEAGGWSHPDYLRSVHTILDPEPALLPHQRALANWIAEYYVTPLSQVAMTMLTPGLVQRSQYVLRLASDA